MNNTLTLPVKILSRSWSNGLAPRWGELFARREEGWITLHPEKLTLQSFCRNGHGTVIAADRIEVHNCKAELKSNRFLRITGEPTGMIGKWCISYPPQPQGYTVTVSIAQEHLPVLQEYLTKEGD